ncbi:related to NADH-dependent flavin oxidoreductase [Saccharomycodes ludwigii]|uniref:Related to NADH-dependent flavin oxidoreductase n=1 Tax=Saccharomycodes ludwigii TaxID=36035 RepID=A0A376B7H5_9ASCO|nr:hypothetical protein SCDLUD_002855 [Saccharomycodes ludwigii]KAH3901363.1 hypothetical protein SCDLUD_002855 [Saccharomycodes ludwigii]SSD60602.1 related to NADH-dependent flavin oxidoreductase [Saccharomycodes ludwigii]
MNVDSTSNLSFFLPKQPEIGKIKNCDGQSPPVFTPLKIRSMSLNNRLGISPMCVYSSSIEIDNVATEFHKIHYGSLASRAPGLIIVESVAVDPIGLITPNDLGLWNEKQATSQFNQITQVCHAFNTKVGVQISHAGRLASSAPPYKNFSYSLKETEGGWPSKIIAPSAASFDPQNFPTPKKMTITEVKEMIKKFGHSARLAVKAGYDFIEIHAAHGYLISEFLSPLCNTRNENDEYGGNWENRIRFLIEIVDEIRENIPVDMPLFVRVSASEYMEGKVPESWTINDTCKLSLELYKHGVDVLDVSSGGIDKDGVAPTPSKDTISSHRALPHEFFCEKIRETSKELIIASPGRIFTGPEANRLVTQGIVDIPLIGRAALKNPGIVWTMADELNVELEQAVEYGWPF